MTAVLADGFLRVGAERTHRCLDAEIRALIGQLACDNPPMARLRGVGHEFLVYATDGVTPMRFVTVQVDDGPTDRPVAYRVHPGYIGALRALVDTVADEQFRH